jgi:hypothetical protein
MVPANEAVLADFKVRRHRFECPYSIHRKQGHRQQARVLAAKKSRNLIG